MRLARGAYRSMVSRALERRSSSSSDIEGEHVLQAVGQLDQEDPDVGAHGQEEFADIFRLMDQLRL